MNTPVTEADRAMIAVLRENARISVADLARRLGISRTAAQSRLDRLEKSGIIAGYALRLSDAYEKGLVRAQVMITAVPRLAPRVVAALGAIEGVRGLYSVSGSFVMIAMVEAPSIEELDRLLDRIGTLEGVERTMSSIILSTRIER